MPARKAQEGKIAALRASRGEDEFVGFCPEKPGYLIPGIVHRCSGDAGRFMNARRIAEPILQKR